MIRGQAGADYRYFRNANETRSFHHHVYSLVEDRLCEEKLLTIDSKFSFNQWTENFFHDGQFIRVVGRSTLDGLCLDYDDARSVTEDDACS